MDFNRATEITLVFELTRNKRTSIKQCDLLVYVTNNHDCSTDVIKNHNLFNQDHMFILRKLNLNSNVFV